MRKFLLESMEDINKLLESLRKNVVRAADRIHMLESENDSLKIQLKKLDLEVIERKSEISKLGRQIEVMKIAGAINSDESDKGSKQKITELVREIDYCITLLR